MDNNNHATHGTIGGVIVGFVSLLLPDVITYLDKLLLAFPVALVGGFSAAAGSWLWSKLRASFTRAP